MYTCQCKCCQMGKSSGVLIKELGGCIFEVSFNGGFTVYYQEVQMKTMFISFSFSKKNKLSELDPFVGGNSHLPS